MIVGDDANLPLGRLRARPDGSDGGHNGLRSIINTLGTSEFSRLRLGVGRGDERRSLASHVLGRFDENQTESINVMAARAADAVEVFVEHGILTVMNRFNAQDQPDSEAGE